MKIRNGFVSNSSSSSFIVSNKHYDDVFELAVEMIKLRDADYEYYDDNDNDKEWRKLKDIITAARENMDPNTPITFPTTNYHTFILKHEDNFIVSTCNNHIEFNYMPGFSHSSKYRKDIKDNFDCDILDDFEDRLSSMTWFWYPHLGVFAKEIPYVRFLSTSYDCPNENCYSFRRILLKNNKEVMCPLCKTVSPVNPKDLELIHQYNIKTPIERIHESMEKFAKTEEAWALDLRLDFALKIIEQLNEQKMDLKTLAEITGIKEKTLEKIIHSDYNFKVNDIAKIGYVLGIKFEVK